MSDTNARISISRRPKIRNYSFQNSKRLPESKMTEVNGVKVPSMPGSCYHAIICALAQNKNKLCFWNRVIELTERYMRQYGGQKSWDKFKNKNNVKSFEQRIKDNTHTLTRTGKDCYGYRLHERGMAIYFYKDGAILLTGGSFEQNGDSYEVSFPDGRGLQVRYRGTTMTSKEYKRFVEMGYINKNGQILDAEGIRKFRSRKIDTIESVDLDLSGVQVCVTLGDKVDQNTALRLEGLGFIVEEAMDKEVIGRIPAENLESLKTDQDIVSVEVVGV